MTFSCIIIDAKKREKLQTAAILVISMSRWLRRRVEFIETLPKPGEEKSLSQIGLAIQPTLGGGQRQFPKNQCLPRQL
jgi:hypothetical protein